MDQIYSFCTWFTKIGLFAFTFLSTICQADPQFRARLLAEPQTLDWNRASTPMETMVLMNLMEGLFSFDSLMRLRPALVESYTVSKDGKTYVFKVKKNILWSDGKPLVAEDFAFSWQRLLAPLTAAPYAYFLFHIEGAEEYNSGKAKSFSKVGIKVVDQHTLEVKLKNPVPYFLQLFTFWVTFPLRKDLVELHGNSWTDPGKLAVVGPFLLSSYERQKQILLKRNEKYYGRTPKIDSVLFQIINEDTTALNLFKRGKLDFVTPVNRLEAGHLVESSAYKTAPYFRTSYLGFNVNKFPLNLPKVRKAIAMAIDKSKISQIMHQTKPAANSFIPEEIFPEGKSMSLEFNPKDAKKLLEDVGLDAEKISGLDLLAFSSDENALLTQYIQSQIKMNLGIEVQIKLLEYRTFRTQLDLQTASIYYLDWGADYADPDTFFGVFLSHSGNNKIKWKNPRYDALVKQAATTMDWSARAKLYREALDLLLRKDVAIVPLHFNSLNYLLQPKIKDFIINPLNYVYFKDIVVLP